MRWPLQPVDWIKIDGLADCVSILLLLSRQLHHISLLFPGLLESVTSRTFTCCQLISVLACQGTFWRCYAGLLEASVSLSLKPSSNETMHQNENSPASALRLISLAWQGLGKAKIDVSDRDLGPVPRVGFICQIDIIVLVGSGHAAIKT